MAAQDNSKKGEKLVCQNRKASFNYFIDDKIEAGLVLTGTEVKTCARGREPGRGLRAGQEAGGLGSSSSNPHYEQGNIYNVDPVRPRKLLLHRREIERLAKHVERQGFALVPTRVYFRNGRAKVEVGLGRGKKAYDKRESLKEREHGREMDRARKWKR